MQKKSKRVDQHEQYFPVQLMVSDAISHHKRCFHPVFIIMTVLRIYSFLLYEGSFRDHDTFFQCYLGMYVLKSKTFFNDYEVTLITISTVLIN